VWLERSVRSRRPVSSDQTRILRSYLTNESKDLCQLEGININGVGVSWTNPPETMRPMEGEKSSDRTRSVWPAKVRTHSPVSAFQTLILVEKSKRESVNQQSTRISFRKERSETYVWSLLPLTTQPPFSPTHAKPLSCPFSRRLHSPVSRSQIRNLPSPEALARQWLSSERALTGPVWRSSLCKSG
jgi:hypothetical protein